MNPSVRFLHPAQAASRLGVSAKALRLYEQRGLVTPLRTDAGWRAYGPAQMQRAADIVALRALGFSLAQVARVIEGNAAGLEPALAAHHAALETQARALAATIDQVRGLRVQLAQGRTPTLDDLARLQHRASAPGVAFTLPWPWGGELFSLREIRRLNYIIGPLGSGKTQLALRLAEVLPGAHFLGLDRAGDAGALARMAADPALRLRVDRALAWLVEEGATDSDALRALLAGMETQGPTLCVVDLVEQGLDAATQLALAAHLQRRGDPRPLFLLTRSSAILDLACVGPDASIILCPANHSPPTRVEPYPGAPGFEAVATCLATPEVRARTEGVIAWRPSRGDDGTASTATGPSARNGVTTPPGPDVDTHTARR